ncbi:hypothetical protein [Qipengyuania sp.]|uniref:hypothetical protein n=1 Tax=Qipengyuania sp. TaxID=2004515 RepID=UPI0035C80515
MYRHVHAALAMASVGLLAVAAAAPVSTMQMAELQQLRFNSHLPVGQGNGSRRSKGAQAHPKRRRNLSRHSQRVRRRHRKAA